MAIITSTNQYKYTGRGPLDTKALVKTFADLTTEATWLGDNNVKIAYNGMVTAVWKDEDRTKNGVYFLYDPVVTTVLQAPNVTISDNWHKLTDIDDLAALTARLNAIEAAFLTVESRLTELEENEDILTYNLRARFPTTGVSGKLYTAVDEGKSYVWYNNDYVLIGSDYNDIELIYGGAAKDQNTK